MSNLQVTEVTGDRALVAGTNTLCGAIATLWRGIQKLVKGARCSIVEAIEAATLHPAQVRRSWISIEQRYSGVSHINF